MTVAELRKDYKVFVKHRRYYAITIDGETTLVGPFSRKEAASYGYSSKEISAKGGSTEVEIYKNQKLLASGYAKCNTHDSFVRKLGLVKALGRAMGDLNMISWVDIINEVGRERLTHFCEGGLSRREFERAGTNARKAVRSLGVDEVRRRARKALARRS